MSKINMAKALSDKKLPRYRRYCGKNYPAGEGLSLVVEDQVKEIVGEFTWYALEEVTGNDWETSDREDYDYMIKINATWAFYRNNGSNAVLKFSK